MPGVSAFVILALVLAVASVAFLVVVARELLRNIRKLTDQVRATTERLAPLSEELQAEIAVTSVEVEGLQRSIERVQKERAGRPKRHRPRRGR